MASVDWVGQDLQCTLKGSGDVIQGQVFTYDKASDSLVLKDHSIKDMANYRFLKGSLIEPSSVKLSGNTAAPDLKDIPVVSDSTIERLRNKESNSVGKEMAKASNIGVNVSTFAQQIFNGLAKTMQCSWDGPVIVIHLGGAEDAVVRIGDKYEAKDVQGSNSQLVERVKKVLIGETERIRAGG